ncbi:MAG: DEAD/DEAH box helicase [Promethearchaeota archaeon]
MKKVICEYINDIYLKKNKIKYRHYQKNIVKLCLNKNSLVVLPTGLGKTIIGILLIAEALKKYTNGKILILAPTRPLVSQHYESCMSFLDIASDKIIMLTGKITPEKRINLFKSAQIIVSTPQVIKNDLDLGRYDLKEVSFIIFDEAHRARGNYPYKFIATEYINTCSDPLILGLTASPGKDIERIQELCDNLYIENVVFKTYNDGDVRGYIYDIDVFMERISLSSQLFELAQIWEHLFNKYLRFFIKRELINPYKKYYSKLDFLRIISDLTKCLRCPYFPDWTETECKHYDYECDLNFNSPKIIDIVLRNKLEPQSIFSYCSSCISILHAKDLLETQDISLFTSFLDRLQERAEADILSAKRIILSKHYNYIRKVITSKNTKYFIHPKIKRLLSIINDEISEFNNHRIIIFTQYRETASLLKNLILEKYNSRIIAEKFIGQAHKDNERGFSQDKQLEIIRKFRKDEINILIATSIAEEGLDIPNVDCIIFYEPVPSEIRLIQRRGRTGRSSPGRCYILVCEETLDVPYYIVANRKEANMNDVLQNSECLKLNASLKRSKINFKENRDKNSLKFVNSIKEYKERRYLEKLRLIDRSIENIIDIIDNFCVSEDYKKLKSYGICLIDDLITLDKERLKNSIRKIKGIKLKKDKRPKRYLNRNLKTIVNLVKIYGENGKINFNKLYSLAQEEDIAEKKFYSHFYQACNLGFIKKINNQVYFINNYD